MKTKNQTHTPGITGCSNCRPVIRVILGMQTNEGVKLCALHAAAPELLEAARKVEFALETNGHPKHLAATCKICAARDWLHAAIAKATGQEGR